MIDLFELKNPTTFAEQLTLKVDRDPGSSVPCVRQHVSKYDKALELFVLYICNAGEDWRENVSTEWMADVITHLVKGKFMDTECDICGKFVVDQNCDEEGNQ